MLPNKANSELSPYSTYRRDLSAVDDFISSSKCPENYHKLVFRPRRQIHNDRVTCVCGSDWWSDHKQTGVGGKPANEKRPTDRSHKKHNPQ